MSDIRYEHWTRLPGIGGSLREPEDFCVSEILAHRYTRYKRTARGVASAHGPYMLCLLKKRNLTTAQAVYAVARSLNISRSAISYAGLKDKHAVTEQYVVIKNAVHPAAGEGWSLHPISTTSQVMSPGDLAGNKFSITLHECDIDHVQDKIAELTAEKMPNFFGSQRFGSAGDNHVIGRLLVQRSFPVALEMINQHSLQYHEIRSVPKQKLKFYINAYQSFLFNELLNRAISKQRTVGTLPIIGATTRSSEIPGDLCLLLKKDGVTAADFSLPELRLSCAGSLRDAFISVHTVTYAISGTSVSLDFTLPPGSYATVLLRELTGAV